MRHHHVILAAICLLWAASDLTAQQWGRGPARSFGLGVIIGEPTGLSAKLWTSPTNALDIGLGWSLGGEQAGRYNESSIGGDRVHVHVDYVWHSFDAIQASERFPLYYGVGGRINTGGIFRSSAAIRGVVGILWLPRDTPIDVFLELAPSLQLTPSSGFGVDIGLGARYFF